MEHAQPIAFVTKSLTSNPSMIVLPKPLFMIGASLLASFAAEAVNDIEPSKEFYTANKTVNPIVIDGDLSEWTGAEVLADPRFYIPKFSGSDPNVEGELVNFEILGDGDWTGPDDHTSAVRVLYDDDNVYFGFVVTDEYHENAANSAWNGARSPDVAAVNASSTL